MSPYSSRTLTAQIDRWWPDVTAGLAHLYPADVAKATAARLEPLVRAAFEARAEELHELDYRAELRPDRLQDPAMIGYAGRTRTGSRARWPAWPSPRLSAGTRRHLPAPVAAAGDPSGPDDGGYAVTDYGAVRPDLGTMDDLRALTAQLRHRGIALVLDLVLNHVAAEHEWARRARAGGERYRRYFHVFPDRTEPDAYEASLPVVFPDWAPGNSPGTTSSTAGCGRPFNSWQWDVNWSNPDVLVEYAGIVLDLANAGVSVLRLDAIAFLWKRLGTDCQGQPEVPRSPRFFAR